MGTKVYQSFLSETIEILGKGFSSGLSLILDPPLQMGVDYRIDAVTANKMTLTLVQGKQWGAEAGFLTVMSVAVKEKIYPLAGGNGIRVAVVLANPAITAGKESFHDSQSKVVYIEGTGFTSVDDTKIVMYPTMPNSYKIIAVLPTKIRIQLIPGVKWLPPYMSFGSTDGADKKVPLQVASIDTGAGTITFDQPITVGNIIKDRAGEVCDDSCNFAFDDVCDDGSESEYSSYYTYYQEDDYGGFAKEEFNDYYTADDSYTVSACLQGTDCTDCGGIDAIVDYTIPPKSDDADAAPIVCNNNCIYAHDNICDDPRGVNYCALGTDCFDCGPVGASNFTQVDDDAAWDDDDDYWKYNDNAFIGQTKGLKETRRGEPAVPVAEPVPVSQYFEAILLGVAYTVGLCVVTAIVLYGTLKACGYRTDVMLRSVLNFGEGHSDIELGATQRMSITPSVASR